MPTVWLRNERLSNVTGGDRINIVDNNPPFVSPGFGTPDFSSNAEMQAACETWYPTSLQSGDLDGYEVTPEGVDSVIFAPPGEGAGFVSEDRNRDYDSSGHLRPVPLPRPVIPPRR